jgi:hypothetical protein
MVWFKKKKNIATATSGHAGDDATMNAMIEQGANLAEPRHWVHYLYFADEAPAREAAAAIAAAGWEIQRVDRSAAEDDSWVVIPERHDAIVNVDTVREARAFFEAIAAARPRSDYDGWEASL